MATESIIDLKIRYQSDVKKGIEETSKSLNNLSRGLKDVGDVGLGAFGPLPNRIAQTVKGLGGLVGAIGPVGAAVGGIGIAFGAALLSAGKFFDNALAQSPQLKGQFDEIRERISKITSWIAEKLTPAFKFFLDIALKIVPDMNRELDKTSSIYKEQQEQLKKLISIQHERETAALDAAISQAVLEGRTVDAMELRQKKEMDLLKNSQMEKQEQAKGNYEILNQLAQKAYDEKSALSIKHKKEQLDLTFETVAAVIDARKAGIDRSKEMVQAADKELESFENAAQERKIEKEKQSAEVLIKIREKVAQNQRAQRKKQDKLFQEEAQAHYNLAQAIAAQEAQLFSTIAQLFISGNKVTKEERLKYKAMMIASTAISTAAGVARALADHPYPLSLILGGLVAATGAVQMGIISQQKFAKGGMIGGGQQSIIVNEQGQEAVLNAEATRRLGREGVDALNSGRGTGNLSVSGPTVIIQGHADKKMVAKVLKNANNDLLRSLKGALDDTSYRMVSR